MKIIFDFSYQMRKSKMSRTNILSSPLPLPPKPFLCLFCVHPLVETKLKSRKPPLFIQGQLSNKTSIKIIFCKQDKIKFRKYFCNNGKNSNSNRRPFANLQHIITFSLSDWFLSKIAKPTVSLYCICILNIVCTS